MKTSRRTFLRVLGSAIIGAVVVPALPPSVIVDPEPLTQGDVFLQALEPWFKAGGAMDRLAVRSQERRQTLARETGLLYDVELAA